LSEGRPLLWRATRQIVASLIAAIFSQPTLKILRQNLFRVRYRLREPPRKRKFQQMPTLS
jgi:hypothetical protein